MMPSFFVSFLDIEQHASFVKRRYSLECEHCGEVGHLIAHGNVYKQVSMVKTEVVGKSLYAANALVILVVAVPYKLTNANMGANTFTEGAIELILRNANGNLRLCKNLCYGSLMDAARNTQKEVTINHVNAILIQPHWRTHKELLTQQVPK